MSHCDCKEFIQKNGLRDYLNDCIDKTIIVGTAIGLDDKEVGRSIVSTLGVLLVERIPIDSLGVFSTDKRTMLLIGFIGHMIRECLQEDYSIEVIYNTIKEVLP